MKSLFTKKQSSQAGFLLVMVLVFGSIFLFIISSFMGYVVTQNKVVNFRYEQQRATEIAEAGLNYYKWYLSHYPDDVTNGTGVPGPYVETYSDPEGGVIGEFSLDVASSSYCGSVASIDVSATGHTYQDPTAVSIVRATYRRPTVAEYSVITNSGVWYGESEPINGPVHTNAGIRMDGSHNSTIASGQTSWNCTSTYGCSTNTTVDGVYTTSGLATPGLFSFPTSPIDFFGLTLDLSNMKSRAQSNGGIYYGPSGGDGYQVTFNGDSTVSIRRVTNTYNYQSYSVEEGYHYGERNVITGTSFVANRTINSACPLLYFEDKVWVSGSINQKVTLAAANLSPGEITNAVLNGDIKYVSGTDAGFLLIAKDDVDVGLTVPDKMVIEGIFIAQNGRFGRNHYSRSLLSNPYKNYTIRESLVHLGTIVSNGRENVIWVSGTTVVSGFENRSITFDQNQVNDPPPLTPETSDVYKFDNWRQDG